MVDGEPAAEAHFSTVLPLVEGAADRPSQPPATASSRLWPRWLFLRALAVVYLSAFVALLFQVRGLVGARGIAPAGEFLRRVEEAMPGMARFWRVPTLHWLASGDRALVVVAAAGAAASLLLLLNLAPRWSAAVCWLCFLSSLNVLQVFASYQSDGMLLEAGLASSLLAPRGWRPGLAAASPPGWAAIVLLRWEWFRIYFESGVVKLASGDPQWRHLTAMDHYYENGPLPTWIAWWAHQLPHGFHAGCAAFILLAELVLVWLGWLPRPFRLACCALVTAMQVSIILTANYAFLNYLVLALGLLLLDDAVLARIGFRLPVSAPSAPLRPSWPPRRRDALVGAGVAFLVFAGASRFVALPSPLQWPARLLAPFRVADGYGLFAVMTEARYEIEFQGTLDGEHWVPYRFRFKPQAVDEAPGIYAPYQPRFEWNLWFASLEDWRQNPWVAETEIALLDRSPHVLALFRADPFAGQTPKAIRTVRYQYWFTDRSTRRATGAWWRREELGEFAPAVERGADGEVRLHE
jgi:hypothetical protein